MMCLKNRKYAMWPMFLFRKAFEGARSVCCIAAILIAVSPNARAGGAVTYFPFDGGVIVTTINANGSRSSSQFPCPKEEPPAQLSNGQDNPNYDVWVQCQRYKTNELTKFGFGFPQGNAAQTARSADREGAPRLAGTVKRAGRTNDAGSALTLSSSTPSLPFLGNPLVVVSYVANSTVAADVTANYAVDLRRQSDCSLTEDFFQPGATTPDTPNGDYIGSLPAAQDYFHKLSGLTTTPDVFASGCSYPILGQSSSTASLLGTTANGAAVGASLANAGIYITIADPTINLLKSTLTIPGTTLGGFSAADVNGDGIQDLVVTFITDPANQQMATAVFLGNGDGTFKSGVYYDIQGDVTIDDVNGDGKPDIVICGLTSGITTLIGKGDGTFTPTALSASGVTPCGPEPGQILTGDFNGDGKKDLLIHSTVLLGKGDGTFTVGSTLPVNPNLFGEFGNVAVGDVNNDGKLDVVASLPGYVVVFYGKGDGTFTAGPRYAGLPDLMQVSLTDIDGDGNLDVVLGTATGGVYTDGCCGEVQEPPLFQLLMGRGDGTFVDSVVYNQGHFGNLNLAVGPQIAGADFNGDGKPDAAVFTAANGGTVLTSTVTVLPGDGNGKLGTPIVSPVTIIPTMLVTATINKDGKADMVLAGAVSGNPAVAVLLNQGNGTFAGELDYTLPSPVVSLVTGDFNGDGITDIAVGVNPGFGNTGASGVYILLGHTNGTFAAPVKMDASLNPTGLAAGDINGDGKTDLVVVDQGLTASTGASNQVNGAVHVYLGNANGSFTPAASPTTSATNYSVAALGDLNGDGKLDLIVAGNIVGTSPGTGSPNVYTLLGNGDGTFKAPVPLALSGQDGIGATSIALADFNKDGHLDVVIGNASDVTEVLLGKGDGTLTDTILTLGQQPLALAAVDLNGDGFPELLIGTIDVSGSGNLTVFLNANAWSVASAPAPVAVPNVVNSTQAAATTAITSAGLVVGAVTSQASATVATGSVISESPSAGTSVAAGSSVNLVVSSGPAGVAVPNVVGSSQASATATITGANLVVGTVTQQSSSTVASGDVISETPSAGTSVAAGSSVSLVVSTGPAASSGGTSGSSSSSGGGGGALDWFSVLGLMVLVTVGRKRAH
jgi:PASTA domain/FG-GAP-like repeat